MAPPLKVESLNGNKNKIANHEVKQTEPIPIILSKKKVNKAHPILEDTKSEQDKTPPTSSEDEDMLDEQIK